MSMPLRDYDRGPDPAKTAPREKRIPLWRALPRILYQFLRSGGDGFRTMQELFKRNGSRTLRFTAGTYELELTIDPERAREILVDDWVDYPKTRWENRVLSPGMEGGLIILEGDEWREHRKALGDLFSGPAMERFAGQVQRSFAERAKEWPGGVFDMQWSREASVIANQAMLTFFFGSPGEAWRVAADLSLVERGMESRVVNPIARLFPKFPPGSRAARALTRVTRLLAGRASSELARCPFHAPLHKLRYKLGGEKALVRELQTLMGAGSTTTHLLGWCGQLLADHPDVQNQLRDELYALGRDPTLEELENAPYLEAVLYEALRLYPPAPFLLRKRASEKLSYSFIPIQAMHRSEEFWDKPDEFLPERWLTQAGTVITPPPYFLPFGAGPRVCIGRRFALIELRVIISELVRAYRVVPAIPGAIGVRNIILTRPKSPVMLFCLPAFAIGTGVAKLVSDEKASDPGRGHDRPSGE
jgi:cytochrome P450